MTVLVGPDYLSEELSERGNMGRQLDHAELVEIGNNIEHVQVTRVDDGVRVKLLCTFCHAETYVGNSAREIVIACWPHQHSA